VEHPIRGCLVLPLTRLEQVAHHSDGAGQSHLRGCLNGLREANDLMAAGHEQLH
jgi:hypothetical protein